MPVRRRKSKARPEEVKAWAGYFESGFDFFGELADAGIVPRGEEPSLELARDTWRRIGRDVLVYLDRFYAGYHPPERPFWAEREFAVAGGK